MSWAVFVKHRRVNAVDVDEPEVPGAVIVRRRSDRAQGVARCCQSRPLEAWADYFSAGGTVGCEISVGPSDAAVEPVDGSFGVVETVVDQQVALRRFHVALDVRIRHDCPFPNADIVEVSGPGVEGIEAESVDYLLFLGIAITVLLVKQKAIQPDMAESGVQLNRSE